MTHTTKILAGRSRCSAFPKLAFAAYATMVSAGLGGIVVVTAAGCATQNGSSATAAATPRPLSSALSTPVKRLLDRAPATDAAGDLRSEDPAVRRAALRTLGCLGTDEGADAAAILLRDPDADVRAAAFFAVGATGSARAAALLEPEIRTATRADAAAAAQGLANCKDDGAQALLIALASRDDRPPEAMESLFCQVRWGGKSLGTKLPASSFLGWATHQEPRGRAALGHLARACKDPALLPSLATLAADPDFEVRRAAALGMANGKDATARSRDDAERAISVLVPMTRDSDARVVAASCRALASYDDPAAVRHLTELLGATDGIVAVAPHADFNVRVAAAEGLGARKTAGTNVGALSANALAGLATADASTSVRYAAAKALLEIDGPRAQTLVPALLADASEFVRSAGAEILAKSPDTDSAVAQLAALAAADPHVRVRETALDGLKEKRTDAAKDAVRARFLDVDPVVAGVACDVAATNGWTDLAPDIRQVYHRFEDKGTPGADAREAAIKALTEMKLDEDQPLFAAAGAHDTDVAVRDAAWKGFEVLVPPAKDAAPTPTERAKHVLPFGVQLLAAPVDLVVTTNVGAFTVRLFPDEAPIHCAHVVDLARKGAYDGLTWHRVVPDFVVQGCCPRGDGAGNAGATLPLESTRIPFERGTLGMPRSNHPDTGGSQWFICHSRAPHLDVHYTAFGRVIDGIEVIDAIDVDDQILTIRVK